MSIFSKFMITLNEGNLPKKGAAHEFKIERKRKDNQDPDKLGFVSMQNYPTGDYEVCIFNQIKNEYARVLIPEAQVAEFKTFVKKQL